MFDAAPTPLDLNFRLLGFPVRVSPWFWLATFLFGMIAVRGGPPAALPLWVVCVFGSILLHELGHAVLFRRYGAWATRIVLHGFGGVALTDRPPASRGKRVLVALAGPAAQLLLCGMVYGSNRLVGWAATNELTALLYLFLVWINLFWPLLNLLPIMPLDGGQVCLNLLGLARVPRAEVKAWGVSTVAAGLVTAVCLLDLIDRLPPAIAEWLPVRLHPISMLFLGLLAVQSYQRMQLAARSYSWDDGGHDRRGRWRP